MNLIVYALNTRDVSDHKRRGIARRIRDGQHRVLRRDKKLVLVRDTIVGEGYNCIDCSAYLSDLAVEAFMPFLVENSVYYVFGW